MDPLNDLALVPPSLDWAAEYGAMVQESVALGELHYPRLFAFLGLSIDDPAGAIEPLLMMETWTGGGAGVVPVSTRWLVAGARIVGEVRLRHRLNPALNHEGGHIGYAVRPADRRQGYGTALLGLILPEADALGINPVLLTCDDDNLPSARIIEHHGGVLEDIRASRLTGKPVRRYWITRG